MIDDNKVLANAEEVKISGERTVVFKRYDVVFPSINHSTPDVYTWQLKGSNRCGVASATSLLSFDSYKRQVLEDLQRAS